MNKLPRAMDLGCLDFGCISVSHKRSGYGDDPDFRSKEADSGEIALSASKSGQKKSPKETWALNKSQKKKPSQRKTSPLGWFPRRKVDSYLNRKIKMLQEVDGMNLTLDETLGDSNPHYCRVLREQMAAREAAHKAMEARKAALIEASWCRIFRAARIQSKEAEALMLRTEEAAAEAFKAATGMGVIMCDKPNSSRKRCQIETSAGSGGVSPTHTITASFETAFEVDKEVAAAVKTAFARLANCPSLSKDEFKELLGKISENPDVSDSHDISEISSACETETDSGLDTLHQIDEEEPGYQKTSYFQMRQLKTKKRQSFGKLTKEKLVDMMFERLQGLQEDELSSLASIVATCGFNAALAEDGNQRPRSSNIEPSVSAHDSSEKTLNAGVRLRRDSNFECFMEGKSRRKLIETEIPSLDKFLVKRLTKLEKEVNEAKMASRDVPEEEQNPSPDSEFPSLDKFLVKHMTKLERDVYETKKASTDVSTEETGLDDGNPEKGAQPDNVQGSGNTLVKHPSRLKKEIEEAKRNGHDSKIPSLDKFLVKHMTKLEREVYEAKKASRDVSTEETGFNDGNPEKGAQPDNVQDLGNILVKHPSRLEKEIEEDKRNAGTSFRTTRKSSNRNFTSSEPIPDLGNLLKKKHTSRLEKEVEEAKRNSAKMYDNGKKTGKMESEAAGLAQIQSLESFLVKHVSRLEKEVQEAKQGSRIDPEARNSKNVAKNIRALTEEAGKENVDMNKNVRKSFETLKNEQAKEDLKVGGEVDSLDKILVKPIHRLKTEKMQALASGTAYGNQRLQQKKQEGEKTASENEGLKKVLMKHVSRLEKEKMRFNTNKEMMKAEKEEKRDPKANNEGGLDEILVKRKPRLEREKIAAAVAAEQSGEQIKMSVTRRQARDRELLEAWGGLGLGHSICPRLSNLEQEKAAWIQAEEEERRRAMNAI